MNQTKKIDESVLNWEELNSIGIKRDELQKSGNLEKLLNWEETEPVSVHISIMDTVRTFDVTLQLKEKGDKIILELNGLQPWESGQEQENPDSYE